MSSPNWSRLALKLLEILEINVLQKLSPPSPPLLINLKWLFEHGFHAFCLSQTWHDLCLLGK